MISTLAEGWTHAISVWDEWVNPNAAFSKSLYLEKKKKKEARSSYDNSSFDEPYSLLNYWQHPN